MTSWLRFTRLKMHSLIKKPVYICFPCRVNLFIKIHSPNSFLIVCHKKSYIAVNSQQFNCIKKMLVGNAIYEWMYANVSMLRTHSVLSLLCGALFSFLFLPHLQLLFFFVIFFYPLATCWLLSTHKNYSIESLFILLFYSHSKF